MLGRKPHIMVFGMGSFAQSAMRILSEDGAKVSCYLTRDYGHFGPQQEGEVFDYKEFPNPCELIRKNKIDLVFPMSINWHQEKWTNEFLQTGTHIFSPIHDAMQLERDRDFARQLCERYDVPFPKSHVAPNRLDALKYVDANPRPYVIKNPLCRPGSPVHTIVCETVVDTKSWLENVDYAEGVFLQEYMGRREAGHIALVSGGEIYSLVTNQEYKRAFDGNMGPVAGAPLGGLVEVDTEDKYGLAKQLLHPLMPWFRETNFNGPVQVTAAQRDGKWYVLEYNVRTGVTAGLPLLRMLKHPVKVMMDTAKNQKLNIEFNSGLSHACVLTLAGWGYPYTKITGPYLTVQMNGKPECDIWWNEVVDKNNDHLFMSGHRIADIVGIGNSLDVAVAKAYQNIKKIYCLSSYYRTDVGQSMWPPGQE